MTRKQRLWTSILVSGALSFSLAGLLAGGAGLAETASSYMPTVITEPFDKVVERMKAAKPGIEAEHQKLLEERYDLSDKPADGVTMSGGKPIQDGVRVKLPNHPEGGMLFPKFQIDEVKKQTQRDLTRFDLDFDLPDRFLPEFPPPIYLTTRPDLGDVSQGKLITLTNYFEVFDGILNPKQLEGLRLLVTPFPQQQFNATDDRRSLVASQGVACFDCHANGHTNAGTHLVGDIRPQNSAIGSIRLACAG